MTTLDLLWGRVCGGLNDADYSAWATALMTSGTESREIVLLAANDDWDWETRERLFSKIMSQIGHSVPKDSMELLELVETQMIEKYLSSEISGECLVHECVKLWRNSDFSERFRIWDMIDEDLCLLSSDHLTLFFEIAPDDIEGSIRRILIDQKILKEELNRGRF